MGARTLNIRGFDLKFPVFMPDATFGLVRGVPNFQLESINIQAVVMNAFHLMQKPGSSTVHALGGLHQMTAWKRPIITDSGGFQAYSLIHQNPKFGSLNEKGILFRPEGSDRRLNLTPEKSIQLQFSFGSDLLICLDDCTHVDASYDDQVRSVEHTINWARRGKAEFERQVNSRKLEDHQKPLIYAVIQGGGYTELRQHCADALLSMGFDGFGFGGWPLDAQSNLLTDILTFTRQIVPNNFIILALGIGQPYNLATCYKLGYDLFDCAMPTRDARHGRLYTFTDPSEVNADHHNWLKYAYINDEKNIKANKPISEFCDCPCCLNFSLGYLHHLHKLNDGLYIQLATLHNLRFMTQLTEILHHARP